MELKVVKAKDEVKREYQLIIEQLKEEALIKESQTKQYI